MVIGFIKNIFGKEEEIIIEKEKPTPKVFDSGSDEEEFASLEETTQPHATPPERQGQHAAITTSDEYSRGQNIVNPDSMNLLTNDGEVNTEEQAAGFGEKEKDGRRVIGRDRRNHQERRQTPKFVRKERRTGSERRDGNDRRFPIQRRMVDPISDAEMDSKRRASDAIKISIYSDDEDGKVATAPVSRPESPTEEYEKYRVRLDAVGIVNSAEETLGYVYRKDTVEEGEKNNHIEINSVYQGDIKLIFNHPSGDVTLQLDNDEEFQLNVEDSYFEQISVSSEKDITMVASFITKAHIRLFNSKEKMDSSEGEQGKKSISNTIKLFFHDISDDMEYLQGNNFRFGKLMVEINNSYNIEVVDNFDRSCRISGPAGSNNLQKLIELIKIENKAS